VERVLYLIATPLIAVLGIAALAGMVYSAITTVNKRMTSEDIRVVGVTTKNEDGQSRQSILQDIKKKKPPFDKLELELRPFLSDEDNAIGVFVNEHQIGTVPRELVPKLMSDWKRIRTLSKLDVDGGKDGKPFGAKVTVIYYER
jgi:uncharacterized protein YpuA (DUF1002 family)